MFINIRISLFQLFHKKVVKNILAYYWICIDQCKSVINIVYSLIIDPFC